MAIKLLIVDDSALMRRQLTQLFLAQGDFEVKQARNGKEAVELSLEFAPDVVTLDINMPEMDGLTALAHIMAARPTPVIMLSSLTDKGALATLEALALGAVDYIAKPGGTISLSISDIEEEIVAKARMASRARLKKTGPSLNKSGATQARPSTNRKATPAPDVITKSSTDRQGVVLVGVSTGGPSTLEHILMELPESFPLPVIVAQHMPSAFTGPFAQRINQSCSLDVVEVAKPMDLLPGKVYIGRGGADVVVNYRGGRRVILPRPESAQHLWHPSAELLGRSALEHFDARDIIAVMLTGMGSDGADAFTEIKNRGGRTIAESEDSAVVFGMPKELIQRNGASAILHASQIGHQLRQWVR